MTDANATESQPVPTRAAAISLTSLAIPMAATVWPSILPMEYQALLWLLALVPAFLLAYYRGWKGVATSLAAGMAFVSVGVALATASGQTLQNRPLLLAVLAAYICISLGVGAVSAQFRRDRAAVFNLALTDPLTGLRNRRFAVDRLQQYYEQARAGTSGLAVVLFDIDHFKQYNDTYGHPTGDEALRIFAGALQSAAASDTLVSRHGGEEFLVALVGKSPQAVLAYIQRVRWNLQIAHVPHRPITVSAGVAMMDEETPSLGELIEAADKALYLAKAQGRNCTRVAETVAKSAIVAESADESTLLMFPTAKIEQAREAALAAAAATQNDAPLVLILEDDPAVASFIERVLRRSHYAVVTCTDPMDAVSLCSRTTPDLIIADIVLANQFGPEIVDICRVVVPDVHVLYISGYTAEDLAGFGMHVADVLQKPFEPARLLEEVRRMIPPPLPITKSLIA